MTRSKSAPKSSRKSRKPRVRSSISSEWLIFELSDSDWVILETAIGERIEQNLRIKIRQIVQRYFRNQPFEVNAPFLADVLKRLTAIKKAALQLQAVLDASQPNNELDIVRAHLALNFEGNDIEILDALLRSLLNAAQLSEVELDEQSDIGFSEGDAWHEMVRSLKELMRSYSMPYGASQDRTNAKDLRGSLFVQFIQSLQGMFPVALRRHHLSDPFALAKEINRPSRHKTGRKL
jgi:hypothetical protein